MKRSTSPILAIGVISMATLLPYSTGGDAEGACANVAPTALTALYRFDGNTVNLVTGIPLSVGVGDSGGFVPGKVGSAANFKW